MVIVYINESDSISAQSLKENMCQRGINPTVIDFTNFTSTADVEGDLTLVAHTYDERKTIGNHTPSALAKAFAKKYPNPEDKLKLKEIFLISCEAGISVDGRPSLAQQLATELNKKGFNEVVIHAVANPVGTPMAEMRVEVVARGGTLTGGFTGQLNAYLFADPLDVIDAEIAKKRREMENTRGAAHTQLSKAVTQLEIQKENQKFTFLTAEDYKEVMRQPCHTFTPAGPNGYMSDSVAFAIHFLLLKKRGERDPKTLGYIERDIHDLQQNTNQNAKATIEFLRRGRSTRDYDGGTFLGISYGSTYCAEVLKPLAEKLLQREQDIPFIQPAGMPAASTSGGSSSDSHTTIMGKIGDTRTKPKADAKPKKPSNPVPPAVKPTNPPPQHTIILEKKELREQLEGYIKMREKEWDYTGNFLGVVSVFYAICDKLFGTNHFNTESRQAKITAAQHLVDILWGHTDVKLDDNDCMALSEGRLGRIVGDKLDRFSLRPQQAKSDATVAPRTN